jgi:plasmid stabilization system protein ParE
MSDSEDLKIYAIRFTRSARSEIDHARDRLAILTDEDAADDWREGLFESISHLATGPHRPLAVESALFEVEVRAFTYRRSGSQVGHRILFTIREETADGPKLIVMALRHGSAAPLRPYEARNIADDLKSK